MTNLTYIGVVGNRGLTPDIDEFIDDTGIDLSHTVFVSGGCKNSPDECIKEYCRKNNLPIQEYYPNWREFPKEKYGNQAFFYRNEQIVLTSDIVYIFYDNKSKGTKLVIDLCKKHNRQYKLLKCK